MPKITLAMDQEEEWPQKTQRAPKRGGRCYGWILGCFVAFRGHPDSSLRHESTHESQTEPGRVLHRLFEGLGRSRPALRDVLVGICQAVSDANHKVLQSLRECVDLGIDR